MPKPRVVRAGRPNQADSQALEAHILDVADQAFAASGYDGASMSAVALAARVGKQTLYRRYPSKAALFRAVAQRRMERIIAVPEAPINLKDPTAELKQLIFAALNAALNPELITMHRILIGEVERFPELADSTGRWGETFVTRCADAVRRLGGKKTTDFDAADFARTLVWAMAGDVFYQSLMGEQLLKTKRARERFFEERWRTAIARLLQNL